MSHIKNMLTARADKETINRTKSAANKVGLSPSDIVRIGVIRVLREIEETGKLEIVPMPKRKLKPRKPQPKKEAGR